MKTYLHSKEMVIQNWEDIYKGWVVTKQRLPDGLRNSVQRLSGARGPEAF